MSSNIDKTLILNKIKDYYHIEKDTEFAEFLDIAPTTLSSWKRRNTFDYETMYAKCVQVSPDFLFTGKGDVEKKMDISSYKLKTDVVIDEQTVPLFDIDVTAGIVTLFDSHRGQMKPVDYLRIPGLPKCDGAVKITGDSMYPLLKSGDTIAYKIIEDYENDIFWGEMYILGIDIAGEGHVTVKYIQKSDREGYVKLVSQNKHHQDKDIKLSKIRGLALVKACVRIISMN